MSTESLIVDHLKANAGMVAIFQYQNTQFRVYPHYAPQQTKRPFAVYNRISSVNNSAMGDDLDIRTVRLQFDVYADKHDEARSAASALRAALQRWQSGDIEDVFVDNEIGLFDHESKLHRVALDFRVICRE